MQATTTLTGSLDDSAKRAAGGLGIPSVVHRRRSGLPIHDVGDAAHGLSAVRGGGGGGLPSSGREREAGTTLFDAIAAASRNAAGGPNAGVRAVGAPTATGMIAGGPGAGAGGLGIGGAVGTHGIAGTSGHAAPGTGAGVVASSVADGLRINLLSGHVPALLTIGLSCIEAIVALSGGQRSILIFARVLVVGCVVACVIHVLIVCVEMGNMRNRFEIAGTLSDAMNQSLVAQLTATHSAGEGFSVACKLSGKWERTVSIFRKKLQSLRVLSRMERDSSATTGEFFVNLDYRDFVELNSSAAHVRAMWALLVASQSMSLSMLSFQSCQFCAVNVLDDMIFRIAAVMGTTRIVPVIEPLVPAVLMANVPGLCALITGLLVDAMVSFTRWSTTGSTSRETPWVTLRIGFVPETNNCLYTGLGALPHLAASYAPFGGFHLAQHLSERAGSGRSSQWGSYASVGRTPSSGDQGLVAPHPSASSYVYGGGYVGMGGLHAAPSSNSPPSPLLGGVASGARATTVHTRGSHAGGSSYPSSLHVEPHQQAPRIRWGRLIVIVERRVTCTDQPRVFKDVLDSIW